METGKIIYEEYDKNLIVNDGKKNIFYRLFGLAPGSSIIALGAGSSSTAAAVTDSHLGAELLGNATRITIGSTSSTSSSFVALSTSDVTLNTIVIGGITYTVQAACRGIFPTTDGNNGSNFREYGLFTTNVLPATSGGTSGSMLNRFVAAADIAKSSVVELDVDTTLYL